MTRTQAEMEARYDAERAGTLYVKPEPSGLLLAVADLIDDDEMVIAKWMDRLIAEETPLCPLEEQVINILLKRQDTEQEDTDGITAILEAIDGGESERKGIDGRFDRVVDAVFDLPEALRERAISMWEGFVDGVKIAALIRD